MLREKETYKYLGILEADTIKQLEMKEKITSVFQENEKATRNQTIYKKFLTKDNHLGYTPCKILGIIQQMDQKTRKFITMHKALHPKDDVDRMYVSRKECGRRHVSIEDIVDTSIQQRIKKED